MNQTQETEKSATEEDEERVRIVGLLASPGHCERVAESIVDSLSDSLAKTIDSDLSWKVEVVREPLTGSNVPMSDMLDEIHDLKEGYNWDYAIALTDIPIRRGKRIVAGQTGGGLDAAIISVPSVGIIRLRHQVESLVLELMDDLYRGTTEADEAARFVDTGDAERGLSTEEEADGDLRYTYSPVRGTLRLLVGMVHANRPWRLFPSFKTTVATAFATGGYGLIFTSLWEIGNAYGNLRQITLMFTAMTILTVWIILSHGLWEEVRPNVTPFVRFLYNMTTVLTIGSGVVFYYIMIFCLLLLAASIYIPAGMLESTIGRPVTAENFARVAWVTSSVATIAGAIGAGLEDSDAVRNSTFGWRQSNRWEQHQQEQERKENTKEEA